MAARCRASHCRRPAALRPRQHTVEGIAAALRQVMPPVVGRIERNALLLDPRTVLPDDEPALLAAITAL